MSVVVPVATQVGLQLLLQPYAQGVGQLINTGVGVVYPAYASYKVKVEAAFSPSLRCCSSYPKTLKPGHQPTSMLTMAGTIITSAQATRALTETDEPRDGAETARSVRWEAARWLTYWGAYGALAFAERVLDKALPWVPYYQTLKLAFLLW